MKFKSKVVKLVNFERLLPNLAAPSSPISLKLLSLKFKCCYKNFISSNIINKKRN